jgi:hypothetical protein
MSWTLSSSGTKTPTVAGSVTVTSASPAVVSMTNNAAAGDLVYFYGTTAPTGVTFYQVYYIISTGLSGSQFEFSATPGGAAINTSSTGSGVSAAIGHVLATDTTNGTYVPKVEVTNMALGDIAKTQVWTTTLSGGSSVLEWESNFAQIPITASKPSPFVASDISVQFVLWQLAGTARAFPWKLLRA